MLREDLVLRVIGRAEPLFQYEMKKFNDEISNRISGSTFLILGGAGSIGYSVVKQLAAFGPAALHVIDISENGLAELVRDIRSSDYEASIDFRTFCIDVGSREFDAFQNSCLQYDYLVNLMAMKHVRSERDPFTLSRMIQTNILNTIKSLDFACETGVQKYFAVSTDKATSPINLMGATKLVMESCLCHYSQKINVSSARFANVAFSKGSLLEGFWFRHRKMQPLAAPSDITRYFITEREAGFMCLVSTLLVDNTNTLIPILNQKVHARTLSEVALNFLDVVGCAPHLFDSEMEAKRAQLEFLDSGKWACYFSPADTAGEKVIEEFHKEGEVVDTDLFQQMGKIAMVPEVPIEVIERFVIEFNALDISDLRKDVLVELINDVCPSLNHEANSNFLDGKM